MRKLRLIIPSFYKSVAVRHAKSGFTLIELLVTLVISGVVLTAAVAAVVAYWRYAAQTEASTRLQSQWGKVNFLLSSEISEADFFNTEGACGGAASLLTLQIPLDEATNNRVQVRYSVNADGDLVRCGPPFTENGDLDTDADPVASILVGNAALVVQLATNRTPTYTLTLNDPITGASYANQVSGSRARVRCIDGAGASNDCPS